jgi:hypothetical protein
MLTKRRILNELQDVINQSNIFFTITSLRESTKYAPEFMVRFHSPGLSRPNTLEFIVSVFTTFNTRKPSARGYNWATLFLGDINTGTWPSRLGSLR